MKKKNTSKKQLRHLLKLNKGKIGKHLSEETKRKIGKANKDKKSYLMTETIRKNMSEAHKGIFPSLETKRKMSAAKKGKPSSRKGIILSDETKRKMSESHRGEKSYLWKGGISPINIKIRKGLEYRLWREAVFARDNYTCQKCGDMGGRLYSHHIFNFSTYLDLRFAIDNGITLCKKCHLEFHKIYGVINNMREQLDAFLI